MKFPSILIISSILLASISLSTLAKGEKVYTWTDGKGVVHYGERPPKDVQAKLVKTRTGHSDPTPVPVAPKTAPVEQAATPATRQPPKDPERCKLAKENLHTLNTVARLSIKNAEGFTVHMTEDDKAKERARMEQIIAQECE